MRLREWIRRFPSRGISLVGVYGLLVVLGLLGSRAAQGTPDADEPPVLLHNFSFAQGLQPYNGSPILGKDGMLYGVTTLGGYGQGVIYRMNPDGSNFQVLHVFEHFLDGFNIWNYDGGYPQATLMQGPDGTLYGTAIALGVFNAGSIFKLNPDGSGYQILHTFAFDDGAGPWAALILGSDGYLYGTTAFGGANGDGVVFQLSTDGSVYNDIHDFGGADGNGPRAALVQDGNGNLWGTTVAGGANNAGVIFELTPDSNASTGFDFTKVHDFNYPADGAQPTAPMVIDANGVLYGTTVVGGMANGSPSNNGVVFSYDPSSATFSVLHSFGSVANDGQYLYTALVLQNGTLYGVTWQGGASNDGIVFSLATDGSNYQILHTFSGTDGAHPECVLALGSNNLLYGTTTQGGSENQGEVFQMDTSGNNFSVLHNFTIPSDGTQPYTGVTEGTDGFLYGTTAAGADTSAGSSFRGDYFSGVLYRVKPDGSQFQVLHRFDSTNGDDGYDPLAPPIQGKDGAFYGVTYNGGLWGGGTVYRWSPTTGFSLIHSFGGFGNDGDNPEYVKLVQDANGVLYGTCSVGGEWGYGIVFSVNPDGSNYQVLHAFGGSANGDGANPYSGVLLGKDGMLYGTTLNGGTNDTGTVYRLDPKNPNNYQILHAFGALMILYSQDTDGALPYGGLVQDANGNLYGFTRDGGMCTNPYASGVLYKIDPSGTFSVLYNFDTPAGALLQDSTPLLAKNGMLYGISILPDTNLWQPTAQMKAYLFQIDTSGNNYQILHTFSTPNPDGTNVDGLPFAATQLIQLSDGDLYGVTQAGGLLGGGAVIRIGPAVSSLSPNHSAAGVSSDLSLTVVGSGFGTNDQVLWNGQALPTTWIDSNHLQVTVPKSSLSTSGSALVQVYDPILQVTTQSLVFLIGQAALQMKVVSVTRDSGGVHVTLTVANTGGADAKNVTISSAGLNALSSTNVPLSVGTVSAGSSSTVTLSFPNSVSSGVALLSVKGTYTGGSFGGSFRVKVP
ncbi:choice-of-anchor tandem repeat GloVer-containing protein [Chthonomonas calidirosea]|uniref:choice-of-anchor tandem repeat GloVer-containing protein n=1 Tax=Chthonomonas calidirosea TaxID=454171 RepID=UPI0006ECC758|nr:choice-of-anchor tandem repeat GloVer-containing protein [Chthonomonas calidirosea]CEK19339.1 hypothetical protein CP488_02489 [Chthonomonas calidirosea]